MKAHSERTLPSFGKAAIMEEMRTGMPACAARAVCRCSGVLLMGVVIGATVPKPSSRCDWA